MGPVMRALHGARDAAFGGRRASGRHTVQWLHGMRRRNRWVRRGLLCPYRGGNRHSGNYCHDNHDRLHLIILPTQTTRIPQLQAAVLEISIFSGSGRGPSSRQGCPPARANSSIGIAAIYFFPSLGCSRAPGSAPRRRGIRGAPGGAPATARDAAGKRRLRAPPDRTKEVYACPR